MKISTFIIALASMITVASCGASSEETAADENTSTEDVSTEETEIEQDPGIMMDLSNEEFKEKMEIAGAVLIDVRSAGEFQEGHIEGARNLDFVSGQLQDSLSTLDTEGTVLVYCHAGGRSASARDLLKENGFMEIYNLTDGFSAWEE